MVRLVVECIAQNLRVDVGAASFGVFVFFNHKTGGAFAHYKTLPVKVKWLAGVCCWFLIPTTHRFDKIKSAVCQRTERGLRSPRHHHICHVVTNISKRLPYRNSAARAGV